MKTLYNILTILLVLAIIFGCFSVIRTLSISPPEWITFPYVLGTMIPSIVIVVIIWVIMLVVKKQIKNE